MNELWAKEPVFVNPLAILHVCDLVRHIARAFNVSEDAVWGWVDKERYQPTIDINHRSHSPNYGFAVTGCCAPALEQGECERLER